MTSAHTAVVEGQFGPFDVLADRAHEEYVHGRCDEAVRLAREAVLLARAAGDLRTVRYLHYTCGLATAEQGRWQEAVVHAHELLAVLDHDDLAWRAKALCLLGDASLRLGRVSPAMDALAEAYSLVEHRVPEHYDDVSAATAVAAVLGHAQLFTPADALLDQCRRSRAMRWQGPVAERARLLVLLEHAVLHATWGAALELDGRHREGRRHHLRAAELALHLIGLAGDQPRLRARAEVVEAHAQMRLGQVELGLARLEGATAGFEQRPELTESQIAAVARGGGLREVGRYDEARASLLLALDGARRGDRLIWELAALSSLALVEVAVHGPHPATRYFVRSRRAASHRLWLERESRFFALRDRISLRALAAEASQLGREAMMDPLTGLGNRRMLDAGIADSLGGAALFVDVDLFKQVNDQYSHGVGDKVLCRVADILRAHCRTHDVVVRFGGDEFVVLLPETSAREAGAVAERVRSAVFREPWNDVQPGLRVSVSIGVGSSQSSADEVLKAADAALYHAKESGRNRVTVY